MIKVCPNFDNLELSEKDLEEIEEFSLADQHKIWYLMSEQGLSYETAKDEIRNVVFYENENDYSLAERFVEDGLIFNNLDSKVIRFLDFNKVVDEFIHGDGWYEGIVGMFKYQY